MRSKQQRGFTLKFCLCLLIIATSQLLIAQQLPVPSNVKVGERLLYVLANQERTQRGLQPLHWDNALYAAARYHATWMARRNDISHQFPGEPDLTARASTLGAHFSIVAENVAIVSEVRDAHVEWMQSPGHRANLLDPQVDSVAIAIEARNGNFYVVQDFSRAVVSLSLEQQEHRIAQILRGSGITVYDMANGSDAAHHICSNQTGWAPTLPNFTMRWTSRDLNTVPAALNSQLVTGKYSTAWVGACDAGDQQGFTTYSLAVMLFLQPPPQLPQSFPDPTQQPQAGHIPPPQN